MLDGVDESFIQRHKQIRLLDFNQTKSGHAADQIFEHPIHQSQIAWQFQFDLLAYLIGWLSSIDTAQLEQIIGAKGQANGGVYQFNVPRREPVKENDMVMTPAGPLGMAIAINFQPTGGGKAAITGDFVLIAQEVNPVLKTLREGGIEVTALHSHMLTEQPRLFFMHFWANDDAGKLARSLKAALNKVKH